MDIWALGKNFHGHFLEEGATLLFRGSLLISFYIFLSKSHFNLPSSTIYLVQGVLGLEISSGCSDITITSGILLYFMLTGGMPFRAENVSKLKKCILEGTYRIPQYLSEQAADIMRKLNIRA